jgi:crotonobetainyl-CoA hydratase
MTNNPITINRNGPVFELVLDRPKANAIDGATSRKMGEAFIEFRDNPHYKVAIVTAAGEKFFCAGWDLKAAAEGEEPTTNYGEGGWAGIQELPNLNKPIIAAINGICCGGGLEWALSCDIIIAAEHATFALPEIKSGIIADAATIKLPKRIPYHIAMELLFTGRWLDAQEAHKWGFVNEIVEKEKLMHRAREMADLLASGPPLVFAAIKEIARYSENHSFQETLNKMNRKEFSTINTLYGSDDQLEGAKAFAEKRDPVWKGK